MSATIEAQACELLHPVLAECVQQRTAVGVAKYGQRLEDNPEPERARIIHAMQEGLDMVQYLLWAGLSAYASQVAEIVNELRGDFALNAEEIMVGGKQ